MTISRRTARDALYTLIKGGVPSAQEVLRYQGSKFEGVSPEVQIVSAGSERQARRFSIVFYFAIHVYVIQSATGWTEEDAEDMLDQVEFEIAQTLDNNQKTNVWLSISWTAPSIIDKVPVSGTPYLFETIPVRMEVPG